MTGTTGSNYRRMGWLPDYPDFRDYTPVHRNVRPLYEKIGLQHIDDLSLSSRVDLRKWCSSVKNQGSIGSCTANAGTGLVEYFEKRAFGKYISASRLFLYKVTRNLMRQNGDCGAYIRTTMGALTMFGVPPEEYWPYDIDRFDDEPSAFCYSFASNYQTTRYVRLDQANTSPGDLLKLVKASLAAGVPSIFGFTVFSPITDSKPDGKIPFPEIGDSVIGSHAVLVVGYDDAVVIKNKRADNATSGALLIRNSWGEEWGESGYGWLPYKYVESGLARDWWSLLDIKWLDTDEFKA